MRHIISLVATIAISIQSTGQLCQITYTDTKTKASFRGLHVADDNSVWVAGSKGWVGRSTNEGKDWTMRQVAGLDKCDFRSVYAMDSDNAVIANAGSPAYVLRTRDGGQSWKVVYQNQDSAAFIDGMDFWNRRKGLLYGDAIGGRMLLLYTNDGGWTWQERKDKHRPVMQAGEASFAASGTGISCMDNGRVVVATGGQTARLLQSRNRGKRWRTIATPMTHGSASKGIYTFMPTQYVGHWLIAGGDYRNDTDRTDNCYYTHNKGKTWQAPVATTRGYRECLTQLQDYPTKGVGPTSTFAVGPTGIDISHDEGKTWQALSDDKDLHVARPSRDHRCLFVAGGKGKVGVMKTWPRGQKQRVAR